ncbi:hypothetical protein JCM31447_16170 [Fluviispira sanaruensis]|uniref:Uncharacterized protein n=1 Tax=Fluviispira sanaruensis TaxID=2493639 RepID=A0A4P2VMC4_FLUSA|nr:hypothetical protein JCM31447_16170 [Fluviispira sanaruensis]
MQASSYFSIELFCVGVVSSKLITQAQKRSDIDDKAIIFLINVNLSTNGRREVTEDITEATNRQRITDDYTKHIFDKITIIKNCLALHI